MDKIFEESLKKLTDEHFFIILLLVSLALIFGFIYCFVRAGTGNFIRTRVWSFFAGSYAINDKVTSVLWSEVIDVENFRFKTGMKFKSKKEIEKFHLWLDRYNIPIYEVMKVSRFFNVQRNYFIVHDFKNIRFKRLVLILMLSFILIAINSFYSDIRENAYLTIKSSKYSFVYKGDAAEAYDKVLNIEFCKNFKKDSLDYIVGNNIKIICKLLMEDSDKKYYESVLNNQKKVFVFLFFINVFFICYFLKSAINYDRADNFKREYIESKWN